MLMRLLVFFYNLILCFFNYYYIIYGGYRVTYMVVHLVIVSYQVWKMLKNIKF